MRLGFSCTEARRPYAGEFVICNVKFLQKYTGFLRTVRLFQTGWNLLHRKGLEHNRELYARYGLKRSIFASLSHKDLKGMKGELPWMDAKLSEQDIRNHPGFTQFPEALQTQLLQWPENGYLIWKNFLSEERVDAINADIDHLLQQKNVDFNYTGRKIFYSYRYSPHILQTVKEKSLTGLLSFILGKKVIPFQTINFLRGSEQQAHSDSIHMSTFPRGYLIAAWIALEDISVEQGPLSYYPGSHHLPHISNEDYDNSASRFFVDGQANEKYEKKVRSMIEGQHLQKKVFTAMKGDCLVWHGNLLHGGEPVLNPALTRKSLVIHYYAEEVICYHEISERPAIFDAQLAG